MSDRYPKGLPNEETVWHDTWLQRFYKCIILRFHF